MRSGRGRVLGPALVLAAVGAAGCGGAQRAAAVEFRFPPEFRASQLVALEADGERRELIASVRRSGAEVEVTLFDPVFAVPVVHARARGGEISEELLAPGPRPGDGKRLAGLLRDLFGRSYAEAGGAAEAGGWTGTVRLGGIPAAPEACRFPSEIALTPRGGAAPVRVRTLDVGCGPAPAP